MSETKFTPGPWSIFKYMDGYGIDGPEKEAVVWIGDFEGSHPGIQRRHDANLIVAAPEMYEALQESNRYLVGELGINHPVVKRNREILAKARGES